MYGNQPPEVDTYSSDLTASTMSGPHRRGPWTAHEDNHLMGLVQTQGALNWVRIAQLIRTRTPKQCRERYHQNLKPTLNHDPITDEEGREIERLVGEIGKRWAEIARRLNGRSDNAVKNWWNGSQNRRKRSITGRRHASAEFPPRDMPDRREYNFATAPASMHGVPRTLPFPPRRAPPALSPSTSFSRSYETPLPSPSLLSPTADSERAPSLMSDSGSHYTTSPRATSSHSTSPIEQIQLPPLKYMDGPSSPGQKLPGFSDLTGSVPRLSLPFRRNAPLPSADDLASPQSHLPTAPNSPVNNLPALRGSAKEEQPQQKESRMQVRGLLN